MTTDLGMFVLSVVSPLLEVSVPVVPARLMLDRVVHFQPGLHASLTVSGGPHRPSLASSPIGELGGRHLGTL